VQVDLSPLTEHPLLRKLAPDVASAWADRLLSPAELTRLERRARRLRGITARDLEALRAWLDPEAPPSARSLARLERGLRQRAPTPAEHAAPSDRVAAEPERRAGPSPRARRLRTLLDGRHSALRDEVRGLIAASDFTLPVAEERSQYRTQVLAWLRRVGELLDAAAGDGEPDLTRFIAAFETLAFHDLSLVVKVGVQFGLFCGAVEQLGTEVHRPLLASARALDQLGCFAMTERGHGSNVRDLETEARYDPASGGFVLHTPTLSAGKEWIGNAAVHARYAVVFAQLWVGDDCHGVHAFVTEIRDPHGAPRPGVRIEDCGPKMGLNGVDNGRLWFEHVALPREALLDRFGRVGAGGEYESDIPSPSRRFFTMLGTLVRGRVAVGGAAISAAKAGLAIALHYVPAAASCPLEDRRSVCWHTPTTGAGCSATSRRSTPPASPNTSSWTRSPARMGSPSAGAWRRGPPR
jgi:acyl-CoA oxidase